MLIRVGSKNNVKIEAVRQVLNGYDQFKDGLVEGIDVESNVSEQPFSLEDTVLGAINRATNAFVDCDYGVGLESGIFFTIVKENRRYFENTVCCIYDGNRHCLGFSPAFELSTTIMKLIFSGMNLEEATKELKLTDNPRVGRAEGIIGILTKGKATRIEYTKPAITMAMIQYQNPELYK
ncbi:MAG: inosine/xanthosine triphosphatase [archaeon]|nr:inosine/xanthosine triphosphatase [archaeon]